MTQSPNLRFFGLNKERKNQSATAQSTARSPTTTTTTTDAVTDPAPQGSQTSVHGWLMNVPGYREERKEQEYSTIVDEDNNGIPTVKSRHLANGRPESISSVSSADSVNLDDLIKNNFTNQVDDETDLPNLADLDLDDSADDFWKMSDALTNFRPSTVNKDEKLSNDRTGHEVLSVDGPFDESEFVGMGKMTANEDDELMNWSPESSTEEKLDTLSNASSRTAQSRLRPPSRFSSPDHRIKTQRSDSLSSENSLTSQSTITTGGAGGGGGGGGGAYARYGMAPMIYPSESTTSNSSRSHSRLSDYSASSSQASSNATSIPRASSRASSSIPSNNSSSNNHGGKHSSGLRRPSDHHIDRSFRSSSRIGGGNGTTGTSGVITTAATASTTSGSRLAKRATHVPLPSSRAAPKPQMVTSSRSTGLSSTRLPSRASHIPAPRASAASPEPRSPTLSPARNNNNRPRSPFTSSRIGGIRSPTPTGGGNPRNSVFTSSSDRRMQEKESYNSSNNNSSNSNNSHPSSRIGRPPSAAGKARPTGLRSPSAIAKSPTSNRRGAA